MKSIILAALLLLPLSAQGAKKRIDVEAEIAEYLRISQVRTDCTVQMFAQGVPQDFGFVYCDCMVSIVSRKYSKSHAIDPSKVPRGELRLIQEKCGDFVADLVKKKRGLGEQASPDKAE